MSQQINLFNPVFLKQKKVFTTLAMVQALGVLMLGLGGFVMYNQVSLGRLRAQEAASQEQLSKRQAQLEEMAKKYPPRTASSALLAELKQAQLRLDALKQVASVLDRGVVGNTEGFARAFRALAQPHVDGLWLTGFKLNGAGNELVIEGRTLRADLVPQFIAGLARQPEFQGKNFGALNISTVTLAAAEPGQTGQEAPYLEFTLQSKPVTKVAP